MLNEFKALPPEDWDIESIIRVQGIRRWHMIPMLREQTLAEHSFNVAALHYVIKCRLDPSYIYGESGMESSALFHDIEEAFTGDIPTPTKRFLNGHAELKEMTVHGIFEDMGTGTPDSLNLVKICDLADGLRYVTKFGIGFAAEHAKQGLQTQLIDKLSTFTGTRHEVIAKAVEVYIES